MNLIFLVRDRSTGIPMVGITRIQPEECTIDTENSEWSNGYDFAGKTALGCRCKWWDGYRRGTVVGVFDLDDDNHVLKLIYALSGFKRDQEDRTIPSRDT